DLVPRLAAVGRLVEAAVRTIAVEPTQGADVDDVRVSGVDCDPADLEGLLEPHVGPRLAAVGRLVDAVAIGDGIAWVALAGADPDDVAVRGGDANVANRHG